jgi:hypothetical protein
LSGYIGSLSFGYVCPLMCMYFFFCFNYSAYMLPITLSYFWYQSGMFLCWVPNGSNVFGFLLGWLPGLFAVFSLFGLIRIIFSFNFLSCLRALSLSLTTVRGSSLSVLRRLFVYGLYTDVRVRALAYLYHLCTGGMFYFCTELYLVLFALVYLVLM